MANEYPREKIAHELRCMADRIEAGETAAMEWYYRTAWCDGWCETPEQVRDLVASELATDETVPPDDPDLQPPFLWGVIVPIQRAHRNADTGAIELRDVTPPGEAI